MDKKRVNDEMLEVVKSDEAKDVYLETIKNIDTDAFQEGGVIQSYKINYETIKLSPMGGIILDLIINDNRMLVIHFILQKDANTGELDNSSGGISSELDDLLIGANRYDK